MLLVVVVVVGATIRRRRVETDRDRSRRRARRVRVDLVLRVTLLSGLLLDRARERFRHSRRRVLPSQPSQYRRYLIEPRELVVKEERNPSRERERERELTSSSSVSCCETRTRCRCRRRRPQSHQSWFDRRAIHLGGTARQNVATSTTSPSANATTSTVGSHGRTVGMITLSKIAREPPSPRERSDKVTRRNDLNVAYNGTQLSRRSVNFSTIRNDTFLPQEREEMSAHL